VVSERDAPTKSPGPARTRERRTVKAIAGLTVVVLAVLGFASYKLVADAGRTSKTAASHRTAAITSTASASSASPAPSPTTASPSPSPSPSPAPAQTRTQTQTLKPAGAAAFGPGGTTDGDGVQQAGYAIDGNPATDWRTDWYTTSLFGGLQAGTGLLVDMGRTVTVAGVQVTLGAARGANLQLRAGNTATLTGLPQVAAVADASGAVQLKPAKPLQARYVLIWFTALPPDGAGTYQVQVYDVSVTGQP
jgi:hypothetical protein